MNAINIENLNKSYDGKTNALNDINLSIQKARYLDFLDLMVLEKLQQLEFLMEFFQQHLATLKF